MMHGVGTLVLCTGTMRCQCLSPFGWRRQLETTETNIWEEGLSLSCGIDKVHAHTRSSWFPESWQTGSVDIFLFLDTGRPWCLYMEETNSTQWICSQEWMNQGCVDWRVSGPWRFWTTKHLELKGPVGTLFFCLGIKLWKVTLKPYIKLTFRIMGAGRLAALGRVPSLTCIFYQELWAEIALATL